MPPVRQRGFTLLELLVVLVIAAAVMAVVAPNLGSGMAVLEARGAVRELASALRYARSQAIAQRRPTALQLDVKSKQYRIDNETRERRLAEELKITLLTGRSEIVGEGVGRIVFFPDGTATGGSITLEAAAGQQWRVDVNWLTGRVAIIEGA